MTKFRSSEQAEGWRAYQEGKTGKHNPYRYPAELWKHDEWYQGWYKALMTDKRGRDISRGSKNDD